MISDRKNGTPDADVLQPGAYEGSWVTKWTRHSPDWNAGRRHTSTIIHYPQRIRGRNALEGNALGKLKRWDGKTGRLRRMRFMA